MRFRSIIALAATLLCASSFALAWPRYDTNQDGIVNFADVINALASGDFSLVNEVLTHWGQEVEPLTPGIDAKAIARWNVVPWQTFEGPFNVGVVAFHMNGIEKVSFSVNGGAWVDVTEKTLNPESGTYEYWIGLNAADYPDRLIEIRAIATRRWGCRGCWRGDRRVYEVSERQPLSLCIAPPNTRPSRALCLAPPGVRTKPATARFTTLPAAGACSVKNVSGMGTPPAAYLLPGEYSFGQRVHPVPLTTDRWLARSDRPGVRKDECASSSGIGGTGSKIDQTGRPFAYWIVPAQAVSDRLYLDSRLLYQPG